MPVTSRNTSIFPQPVHKPAGLVVMTQGDPSGIGPELTLRAYLAALEDRTIPRFIVTADPAILRRTILSLGFDIEIMETDCAHAAQVFQNALPVLPVVAARGVPGQPDPDDAPSTLTSIERATEAVHAGMADAVVTNPIAKEVLYKAGFPHPGHTEFLGALTARLYGQTVRPVMLLWSRMLAVTPVTIHIPLVSVPRLLTSALIVETGQTVASDMRTRFGLESPRLAISGLNPHAGEGGAIGREETDIIAPAIASLVSQGIDARGPFPADTLFHAAARQNYDVALCMTHDQALIPIKTLCFESAVNVTLGMPFIRTSPDHGTAFDIAGRGVASPTSLIEALRLSSRLFSNSVCGHTGARHEALFRD